MEDLRANGSILNNAIQKVHQRGVKGKLFSANSIIMAITVTIGEHALITVDYLSNQRFTNFAIKKEFDKFFEYNMQHAKGVKMPRGDKAAILNYLIPITPLVEQERIVAILDKFDPLTTSITEGLPREIELRQQQYEYYREQLLNFPKL